MAFHSYEFIFYFLPIVIIVFYATAKVKNVNLSIFVITLASFVFYFINARIVGIFLVVDWLLNQWLYYQIRKKHSRFILGIAIILNVSMLLVIKYYNFAVDILNYVFRTSLQIKNIAVPLGISFITFQQIAFLVDTYRGYINDASAIEYCSFTTFFPHISSGPIMYFDKFAEQVRNGIFNVNWENISSGIYLFSIGLSKKILLGDRLGMAVDLAWSDVSTLNTVTALFVSIAYTLQIYFDFSGYCDMASGVARLFNIKLPVNFNSPYKALSINDFWKRWHMSLTGFFTKYVYFPLGGNRKGTFRTFLNIMIIFTLSGLWHGAGITFILWGVLHGFCMILSKQFSAFTMRLNKVVRCALTFLIVNMLWILFRAKSFHTAKGFVTAMFSGGVQLDERITALFTHFFGFEITILSATTLTYIFFAICLVIVFIPQNAIEHVEKNELNAKDALATIILFFLSVVSFSSVTSYIYNGF